MSCWIVIPAKAPPAAKGRLASALAPDRRQALAEAMLLRALDAAQAVDAAHTVLVGTSRMGAGLEVELLADPGSGLNPAVTSARSELALRGCTRIVTLAADLPQVTAEDVAALCDLPDGVAGIAPDRHGTGTNALSLPLPAALGFAYSYGLGSLALHRAEAARLGLELTDICRPGLARDIDEPEDLSDALGLLAPEENRHD